VLLHTLTNPKVADCWFESSGRYIYFLQCRISEWTLMSISEHFRYRNEVFQSDIFVSDIGITDVDVGYRISPTLRLMSMPTYVNSLLTHRNLLLYRTVYKGSSFLPIPDASPTTPTQNCASKRCQDFAAVLVFFCCSDNVDIMCLVIGWSGQGATGVRFWNY
jgi:hypothetical protein